MTKSKRNREILSQNHMDAVAYWTAQQTYRQELAAARAAANKSAPSSSGSIPSSVSSAASVSSFSCLDLSIFRPSTMIIMDANPTVPQVTSLRFK